MTDLEQQIARMKAAYEKLPGYAKAAGKEFFSEVLGTFDAVQNEAAELRRLIEDIE